MKSLNCRIKSKQSLPLANSINAYQQNRSGANIINYTGSPNTLSGGPPLQLSPAPQSSEGSSHSRLSIPTFPSHPPPPLSSTLSPNSIQAAGNVPFSGSGPDLSNNAGISVNPQISSSGTNVYAVWQDSSPGNDDIFFRSGS
jgi:hypothetical protein